MRRIKTWATLAATTIILVASAVSVSATMCVPCGSGIYWKSNGSYNYSQAQVVAKASGGGKAIVGVGIVRTNRAITCYAETTVRSGNTITCYSGKLQGERAYECVCNFRQG